MTSIANDRNTEANRKAIRATRDAEKASIELLMRTVHGRKWVWDLLGAGLAFHPLPNDPQSMAIAEGERRASLRLLTAVTRYCPADYIRMTQENTGITLEDQPDDRSDPES